MGSYCITDFGARPGLGNNRVAIQAALDTCAGQGGGRVVVPAGGVFVTGTLRLHSGVELHVEGGATLRASQKEEDYVAAKIAGEYGGSHGGFLIEARNARDVSLTGMGTIDGQGAAFMDGWWTDDGPYIRKPKAFRPRLIGFFDCTHLRIRDLTILDAPQWTCHLTACEDVVVHGLTIRNALDIPNCDGIDPDHCRNVRISDCHIEAGDDGIVIKNTREFADRGPSENITVTGCTIVSTSAAIKIGTESHGDFRDIVVSNCVVRRSHRGFAIQLRDHGNVENIIFANSVIETRQFHPKWWGNAEAVYITAAPRHPDTRVGTVRNVLCSHLLVRGENGIFLHGQPETPLRDIVFDQIRGELRKTSKFPIDFHDLRPTGSEEHGGLERAPLAAVTARHVDGLVLRDCALSIHPPDASHWSGERDLKGVERLTEDGSRI